MSSQKEEQEMSFVTAGIVLLGTLVLTRLWYSYMTQKQDAKQGARPPSPPTMPILNNHLHIALKHLASPKSHEFMIEMHKKYGPVVELDLPVGKMVLISNPNSMRRIWSSSSEFYRNDILQVAAGNFLKAALFAIPSGPVWQRHRKLLQPVFAPANLRSAALRAQDIFTGLFESWKEILLQGKDLNANQKLRVQFSKAAKSVVVDTIGSVAFSHRFEAVKSFLNNKECEGIQPIQDMMRMMQKRIGIPPFMWFLSGSSATGSEAKRIRYEIETFLKEIIEDKKSKLTASQNVDAAEEEKLKMDSYNLKWDLDIVDRLLLGTTNTGDKFSDEEIIDETIGFFLGGLDTSSRSLESLFVNLGQNPEVTDKLIQEIDQVIATLPEGPISMADLNKFAYLDNVVKESMRYSPIVGSFPRCCSKEVEMDGYTFPPETVFMMNLLVANKHPAVWKDPETFNPDRFNNPEECKAFLPFGDGPTSCIGQKLASIQIKLFVIRFFSYFKFEIVPGQSFEKETTLTLGLEHPLELLISLRN